MNKDLILFAARKENEGILDEYEVEGWSHSFVVAGHLMRLFTVLMLLAIIIYVLVAFPLKQTLDGAVLAAMMGAAAMLQLMDALIRFMIYHNIKRKNYFLQGLVSTVLFLGILGMLIAMLIMRVK